MSNITSGGRHWAPRPGPSIIHRGGVEDVSGDETIITCGSFDGISSTERIITGDSKDGIVKVV